MRQASVVVLTINFNEYFLLFLFYFLLRRRKLWKTRGRKKWASLSKVAYFPCSVQEVRCQAFLIKPRSLSFLKRPKCFHSWRFASLCHVCSRSHKFREEFFMLKRSLLKMFSDWRKLLEINQIFILAHKLKNTRENKFFFLWNNLGSFY